MTHLARRLVCSWFTISGSKPGPPPEYAPPSRRSIPERALAAAKAGFHGIGLRYDDYGIWLKSGGTESELRRILDDVGVVVDEIEFISGWDSADPEVRRQGRLVENQLYATADALGVRQVNAGSPDPVDVFAPFERLVEGFAGVCDRAAAHGLSVALEFMPWAVFPDARSAWRVVEAAGRSNGGILLDTWHYFRGSADPAQLRGIPASRVVGVQIDDADAEVVGDVLFDSLHHRRFPGEGAFPLIDFLRLLDDLGVNAPLAVEVISDDVAPEPLETVAAQAFRTTESVLRKAHDREASD